MRLSEEFLKGFKDFGVIITTIVNSILLSITYILGVGITSIIARASGKRFLDVKKEKKKTYWKDYNLKKEDKDKYYRQF
ncbi:MAG: hypothetical protein ACP5NW_05135 [Candidatus Woesearchaeota archaeon]